jgi:hypothetical protein
MDKFLIRKIEVVTEPECKAMASSSVTSFVEQDNPRAKNQKINKIKHRMGILLCSAWTATSLCRMWCVAPLSNHSMKPSLLQRHFNSCHNSMKGKSKDFFDAKKRRFIHTAGNIKTNVNISSKCLQVSYAISLRAAKYKTPHTVVQELVVPSAIGIASIMLDDKIVSQIKAIPCSDNTVRRRTVEMAADVTDQVVEKIVLAKNSFFNWMKIRTCQMKLNWWRL